ncbi:MAG: FKBP-type peptidyl-prolyl cis-trans isomerase [Patescibacteria group bacterium]
MQSDTTGVKIEDTLNGQGDVAVAGDMVTVNYVGTLPDGKVFDSSIDRGQPFTFQLGVGQVIRGWDEGFVGMRVGGKRKLTISPDYGYGAQTVGPIPANSTLIFEVDLLKVEHPAQAQ